MNIYGIDISGYQPVIDWDQVKASGKVQFVFSKATQGTTYTEPEFIPQHDGAKRVGIPFGAYHFFEPSADPIAQARYFLNAISGREGQLLPMVDVEVSDGCSSAQIVDALSKFVTEVEKSLNGKKCIIYSDYGFWNDAMGGSDAFSGHPFWVAEYNDDAEPAMPNGIRNWVIWQFTDSYPVPSVSDTPDGDKLNGDSLSIIER